MKKNNLLNDTRKTYHNVWKIIRINTIKGRGSLFFYYRLLKIRKLIIKWYFRNDNSLLMLGIKRFDYDLKYGLKNDFSYRTDSNIKHILTLVNTFMETCTEIEDYYNE